MTVEVADESVWEGIEKGEITGLSMGGLGNYSEEDVELENVSKQETSEKKRAAETVGESVGAERGGKGGYGGALRGAQQGHALLERF